MPPTDHARFPDRRAWGVLEVRRGRAALDAVGTEGFWALVATFEGQATAVRYEHVERSEGVERPASVNDDPDVAPGSSPNTSWSPLTGTWRTSLSRPEYVDAVEQVRARISTGEVYQVNICRVLSHELSEHADLDGLDGIVRQGNPAPHSARIRCARAGLDVVCASPELFLDVHRGRVTSRPIKGTADVAANLLPKDRAENVMIVDLVRNDISPVCVPGTVRVDGLCDLETHPGLVHLVSTVSGRLAPGATWPQIFAASFPPGSVSGAPKHTALKAIRELERGPRGPYCGAVGWVDADVGEASLAVGIRTFWSEYDEDGRRWLRFGTGAGITWASDPQGEWEETELKAARLVGLASGAQPDVAGSAHA